MRRDSRRCIRGTSDGRILKSCGSQNEPDWVQRSAFSKVSNNESDRFSSVSEIELHLDNCCLLSSVVLTVSKRYRIATLLAAHFDRKFMPND
jgi:hypothetical protein